MSKPKIKEALIFYSWLLLNLVNVVAVFGVQSILSGLAKDVQDPHTRVRLALLEVIGFGFSVILSYFVFRFTISKVILPKISFAHD